MFGLFEKKREPITDKDMIKLMPADKAHFAELICDEDIPRDLYRVSHVEVTLRRQSVERKLVRCRDSVKTILSLLKKHQAIVYYVAPKWFKLEVKDADGSRVRCSARFNITSETSAGLVDWLELNVKKEGVFLSIDEVAALLNGKPKPDWLEIKDAELVAEPDPEEAQQSEDADVTVQTVDSLGVGSVVFDRYLIERELGEGGMGKVFLALDKKTPNKMRERVVLKVMHIETAYDPHALDQFIKEAETLSSLRNDRIAACFDCVMLGETPILLMEYVEGESLDKFLLKHGPVLDEKTTKDLLLPMAQALDYAHQMKIYHLDVKPQNIIVRKDPKAGIKTCLLDFGIARKAHADGSMTFTRSVSGTLLYMSPDQLSGETPNAAMDVYSLAVTAYECLTGEMPYPHGWKPSCSVRPISSDTPFAEAIMRGLSSIPAHRPDSCVSLISPSPLKALPKKVKSDVESELVGVGHDLSSGKPPAEVEHSSAEDSLADLGKTFINYRTMLAQSANKMMRTNPEQAEWLRDRQAALRDLTKDIATVNPEDLVVFFAGVRTKLSELKMTPADFFVAADRLNELRCGLPKDGGKVWQAVCDSVR